VKPVLIVFESGLCALTTQADWSLNACSKGDWSFIPAELGKLAARMSMKALVTETPNQSKEER
jgi:hypothetical protein